MHGKAQNFRSFNVTVTKGAFRISLRRKSKQPARGGMGYFISQDLDLAVTIKNVLNKREFYFSFLEKFELVLCLCSENSSETQVPFVLLLLYHSDLVHMIQGGSPSCLSIR